MTSLPLICKDADPDSQMKMVSGQLKDSLNGNLSKWDQLFRRQLAGDNITFNEGTFS